MKYLIDFSETNVLFIKLILDNCVKSQHGLQRMTGLGTSDNVLGCHILVC